MKHKENEESIRVLEAIKTISNFSKSSLTSKISKIEKDLSKTNREWIIKYLDKANIDSSLLESAFQIKQISSQIDILIHSVGILLVLPHILDDNETIEALSLGAGNTGKSFDLETDQRIAEFKFIHWKGGAESIRQNSLFKDFFGLAEFETNKKRFLYVLNSEKPMKFFNGNRALKSVLSKSNKLLEKFNCLYGNKYKTVSEYYNFQKNNVKIIDIEKFVSQLVNYNDNSLMKRQKLE